MVAEHVATNNFTWKGQAGLNDKPIQQIRSQPMQLDSLNKVLEALDCIEIKGANNAFLLAYCAQTIAQIIDDVSAEVQKNE